MINKKGNGVIISILFWPLIIRMSLFVAGALSIAGFLIGVYYLSTQKNTAMPANQVVTHSAPTPATK